MAGDAPKKKLTLKQRRFVEEYAADPNAVQAYFRAFGRHTSKGTRRSYAAAQVSSSQLLLNPIIDAEVKAAQRAWLKRVGVDKERVLSELATIAFLDPEDLYQEGDEGEPVVRKWGDVPATARKALASVKVKRKRLASDRDATAWEVEEVEYKFHSKLDALDKLCKRLGLLQGEPPEGAAGDNEKVLSVEHVTKLLATLLANRPVAGSAGGSGGGAVAGNAVGAEPRTPEPGVPE